MLFQFRFFLPCCKQKLHEPKSYVTLVQVLSAVANRNYQEPKSYVTLAQVLSALLQIEIKQNIKNRTKKLCDTSSGPFRPAAIRNDQAPKSYASGSICPVANRNYQELDSVGSTVRYEMIKLCTGSVQDTMRRLQLVAVG